MKVSNSARTFEELGDYFKRLEKSYTLGKLMPYCYTIIRLDGRAFHSFCKGLEKPFSKQLIKTMAETCIDIGREFHPLFIYVQSDEITVVFDASHPHMFDGTVQKLLSVMASFTSVAFCKNVLRYMPSHESKTPHFDARVIQVATAQEVFDNIIWRQIDAKKNSVTLLASAYFSHKELHKKNTNMKKDMLLEIGVSYAALDNEIPHFTRGTFFKSQSTVMTNETGEYTRNIWKEYQCPSLFKINEGTDEEKTTIEKLFIKREKQHA